MKQWTGILKQISMLTQFGLSFITPLLLCLGICYLLCSRVGLGGWIYILGFFFGLGGSFTVAWKMYRQVQKDGKKNSTPPVKGYNRHE